LCKARNIAQVRRGEAMLSANVSPTNVPQVDIDNAKKLSNNYRLLVEADQVLHNVCYQTSTTMAGQRQLSWPVLT